MIELLSEFKIKAIATGGASNSKPVTVKIIVCRYEDLSSGPTIARTVYVNPLAPTDLTVNDMFSSNDTFCPPRTYALTTDSPSDPAAATAPSANQLLTYNMDSVGDIFTLHLLDSDVSTQTFFVLSQSISGKFVYQQVELTIECTTYSQTLAPIDVGSDLLEKDKNQGVVSLLSSAELLALFSRSDSARCPITAFALYTTDDSLI